nr:hypothetical protein BaRGS_025131 [Batillaria attramentaria]
MSGEAPSILDIRDTRDTRLRRDGEPCILRMVAGEAPAGIRMELRAMASVDILRRMDFRLMSLKAESA